VGGAVAVAVDVGVSVDVAVEVRDEVGVTLGVWVRVAVGVAVTVGVAVIVGVFVGVGVEDGVGVGASGQMAQPSCTSQATFPKQNSAGGQSSIWQKEEQPSQFAVLPSSQRSGNSTVRFPQTGQGTRQSSNGFSAVQNGRGFIVGAGRTELLARMGARDTGWKTEIEPSLPEANVF